MADVRSISHALRPAALEQVGFTKAIEWMVEQTSRVSAARFSSEIDIIDGLLPAELDINLYRIIQEALNNVVKHSQASHVIVSVKRELIGIAVSILDDGRGFDPEAEQYGQKSPGRKPSLGLVSMTERAKLLGAEIKIQSTKGMGTRLTLTMPLPEVPHNGQRQDVDSAFIVPSRALDQKRVNRADRPEKSGANG